MISVEAFASGKICDATALDFWDHMLEALSKPDPKHCESIVGGCQCTCGMILFL